MPLTARITFIFSTLVIAVLSLVYAVGQIVSDQDALAANLCGSGLGCGGASNYGCDGCGGISYPSPLSNFFGGEAFPFHHFHGGFGFHHFHGGFGFHHFHGGFGFNHFGGFHHFH